MSVFVAVWCLVFSVLGHSSAAASEPMAAYTEVTQQQCDAGTSTSCTDLGTYLAKGDGLDQDLDRARALFEKGCTGGDALGCSNLGVVYQRGLGVDVDRERAGAYYDRACEGGLALACTQRERLEQGNDAVELAAPRTVPIPTGVAGGTVGGVRQSAICGAGDPQCSDVELVDHEGVEPKKLVPARYPDAARPMNLGDVKCRTFVSIDTKGRPTDVRVVGCPQVFHESVKQAISKSRWRPYTIDGTKA
ncbi:MAG: energy transducer TonB, partial [Myxococcota bacterium]